MGYCKKVVTIQWTCIICAVLLRAIFNNGPFNVFMKFQWLPAVHTCLKMFNVIGPIIQKDTGLIPVNSTACALT